MPVLQPASLEERAGSLMSESRLLMSESRLLNEYGSARLSSSRGMARLGSARLGARLGSAQEENPSRLRRLGSGWLRLVEPPQH
jgi:hypothetical protein